MKNKTTRRVVTGNNSEGKSYFVLDGPTPGRFDIGVLQSRFDTQGTMEEGGGGMHTTPTIDYGIVFSGRVCLELDEGEVELGAGDVLVQRSTRHAWHNRSDQPCTVAFVLISSPNYT